MLAGVSPTGLGAHMLVYVPQHTTPCPQKGQKRAAGSISGLEVTTAFILKKHSCRSNCDYDPLSPRLVPDIDPTVRAPGSRSKGLLSSLRAPLITSHGVILSRVSCIAFPMP